MAKMTSQDARRIALDGFKVLTLYENSFPWNCGLKTADGAVWGDCWCMYPKVLVWSWACGIHPFLNRQIGTFFYNGSNGSYDGIGKSGLPDWDGDTIMKYCTGVSSNFSRLEPAMLMLISGHHMAMYIGDYSMNGYTYNSVEFNYFNDEVQGQIPFWVDSYGQRYWCKGGSPMGGRFDLCGKLSRWIDYVNTPSGKIDVDGEWGCDTTRLCQKVMRAEYPELEVDGIISSQEIVQKKYLLNADPSSWEFVAYPLGSPTIRVVQNRLNQLGYDAGAEDGIAGQMTIKALQRFLNDRGASLEVDGYMGELTVKAYQSFLNTFV